MFDREKVIQIADLGANSGALEVRFIREHGVRRAFINTPGTSAVWLADDDDRDGVFEFQQVLGPDDGLELPVDMLLSYDRRYLYLTNWFGNTVQQFDITDPFNPVLTATESVPHPNMLRLSRDNKRLYVSNSVLHAVGQRPRLRDLHATTTTGSGGSTWSKVRASHPIQFRRKRLGEFHQRREEDHDRTGRATHDALRPEHPAGAW